MTYLTLVDGVPSPTDTVTMTTARILIVEDNANLAYGLRTGLEIEGYEVQVAEDGETGLERAKRW
ncbi:MAG TPA: response regulator, partial [Gemmatimonadaceae bacterium]|nr:response regulator [Gemmatimonadaceae bacterium]